MGFLKMMENFRKILNKEKERIVMNNKRKNGNKQKTKSDVGIEKIMTVLKQVSTFDSKSAWEEIRKERRRERN